MISEKPIKPQNKKQYKNDRFIILSKSIIVSIVVRKQNIRNQGLWQTLE